MYCAFCGNNRGVGLHHVVFRSHGGHAGPVLPLCQRCHDNIHDRVWECLLIEDGIHLYDIQSGELIWRKLAWKVPGFTDAGQFISMISTVSDALRLLPQVAPSLSSDEAIELYRTLRAHSDAGWKAECRLLGEMYRYRFPGRSQDERIQALDDAFGIRRSQVYNLLAVYREFAETEVFDDSPLGQSYFIQAARANEPVAAIHLAEERKMAVPQFSAADLRTELAAGQHLKEQPAQPAPASTQVWARHTCSHCGTVTIGWVEKLPVGSDGQPIDMAQFSD
jgi:hypothetical protein